MILLFVDDYDSRDRMPDRDRDRHGDRLIHNFSVLELNYVV